MDPIDFLRLIKDKLDSSSDMLDWQVDQKSKGLICTAIFMDENQPIALTIILEQDEENL